MRKLLSAALAATFLSAAAAALPVATPQVAERIAVPDGGWDLLAVDQEARRVLVARTDGVTAIDLADGKVTGRLVAGARLHAVVPIPHSGLALATAGGSNSAILFDARTGAVRGEVKTGANPDAAIYEPASRTIWVMNAKDGSITIVDPRAAKAVGTLAVGGALELPALDGRGHLFVNVEDKNEIVEIALSARKVMKHIALPGCDGPTGLAFATDGILVSACGNGVAKLVRASDGKLMGEIAIGPHPDGAFADPGRRRVYIPSGGDGTLAILDTSGPLPRKVATVQTQRGARTGAVDLASGRVYLPAARYEAPAAPGQRPKLVPGSVEILVVQPGNRISG
jgi:DNA-binding beta-propeller fold protein YncE